jgi:epidermal growth factor receptor substrate 15
VSEASVQDLHIQLRDIQSSASQAHDTLQQELDSCRERKRHEDASRSELKSRTKTLDDSKRTAESLKREVDRKLKIAQTTRDNAQERIVALDKEISSFNEQLENDRSFLEHKSTELSQEDVELSDALEVKKKEIKATEGLLAVSNRKSRELEDTLASERERLKMLKHRSQARRQELIQRQRESPPSSILDDFAHSTQYNHFLDQYRGADGYDHSTLEQQHAPRAVYGSRRSGSLQGSPLEEAESAYDFGYTGGPYGSDVGHISNGVYQVKGDSGSRRRTQNSVHDYLPYDGTAAVPPTWNLSSTDDLGYLNGPYSNGSFPNGQVKKGLNPGAKAFTLGRQITPPYDALNPNGLGVSSTKSATSTTSSLLRAFAPSRAEREVLQRALGGSTNSSFERLPSLSDVGSIPSSPSHVQVSPTISLPQVASSADATKSLHLPSWFPTFLPRKSKFKPWDDDELAASESK